jgi:exoribonuclease R
MSRKDIMNQDEALSKLFGVSPCEQEPTGIRGILQTTDYLHFIILSDTGNELFTFTGAKLANKCLPGDHVRWNKGTDTQSDKHCELELRDQHPLIVGTIELTGSSTYGLTKRGIPMYLFTPYDKSYPHFIVGCSEKDKRFNKIGLIQLEDWTATFPRGSLQQTLGMSGDYQAEELALQWQACPWKYPKYEYEPKINDTARTELQGVTFHIDPEGCQDVDDVLTFEKITAVCWRVTITISDVAAFVEDGGAIDIMASLIGQTLYNKEGKVLRPMLPSAYSEKACSLLPGKQSYGISLQFIWDGMAIYDIQWLETTLRVNHSYSYEEFQESESPYKAVIAAITSHIAQKDITDSHEWIEYMMIFYNTEAGKKLKKAGMGILRRHSAPDRERLEKYDTHFPELRFLAFSAAEYVLAEEQDTVHYGLASDTYAHASSPIRRYADLVNQRVLKQLIRKSPNGYIVPITMYDMNRRGKAIKRFQRDMDFLDALKTGCTTFTGTIMEKIRIEDHTKIRIYLPQWKRMISTMYKTVSDDVVLSRDEKSEINVLLYREVQVHCTFLMQSRNWKERVVLQIK